MCIYLSIYIYIFSFDCCLFCCCFSSYVYSCIMYTNKCIYTCAGISGDATNWPTVLAASQSHKMIHVTQTEDCA